MPVPFPRLRCVHLIFAGVVVLLPAMAAKAEDKPGKRPAAGKIYAALNVVVNRGVALVAIDPATGEQTLILENCGTRPRVSPDGKTVAFERNGVVWTRSVEGGDEPKKVVDLDGGSSGSPPVWAGDGKKIVVSPATRDEKADKWVHLTIRVNADGSDVTELPIPKEDGVYDWSPDGRWFVTESSRNAKIGWQVYAMRPDGKDVRQLTEGGNPYYVRFAPDSRRVLYTDGTSEERRGIWVVDVDGKNRRKICSTGKAHVSACWSPDGKQVAVAFRHFNVAGADREKDVIEVMDLDGNRVSLIDLPDGSGVEMPDWR